MRQLLIILLHTFKHTQLAPSQQPNILRNKTHSETLPHTHSHRANRHVPGW